MRLIFHIFDIYQHRLIKIARSSFYYNILSDRVNACYSLFNHNAIFNIYSHSVIQYSVNLNQKRLKMHIQGTVAINLYLHARDLERNVGIREVNVKDSNWQCKW